MPLLYLDKEGFNYYDNKRLKKVNDGEYSIYVSSIASRSLEIPLARFDGPICMIVFRSPQDHFQRTVGLHNFELFTLHIE